MFLGIDLGTSEVKVLLIDESGAVAGSAGSPLEVQRPHPRWSEQSPEAWWQGTLSAVEALRREHPERLAAVRGVGLSGQMHGATLLDAGDWPLRPAILWNDARSGLECEELVAKVPATHAITGNLAMPGFTAPTLIWVAKHEPEVFARVATVLLPNNYLRLRLTGEKVSDMDDAASAVGIGAIAPGDGFVSLGTSGVLFVVNDRFSPNPARAVHAFCHALPRRWHQMSVMLSAASCLRWATRLVGGASEGAVLAEVATLEEAERERAPIFLPYLSGERTPHNDPAAQGVFFGLTHGADRRALVYSVIEGVSFGLADGLDALASAGTRAGTLSLVGGGSRSALWAQLLADVLQTSLRVHAGSEAGGALGAARLGHLAAGGDERTVCTRPPVASEHVPSRDAAARFKRRLERFRALYRALSPVWKGPSKDEPT